MIVQENLAKDTASLVKKPSANNNDNRVVNTFRDVNVDNVIPFVPQVLYAK